MVTRIKTDLMINAPSSVMRSDTILPRFYFDRNYEAHIPTRDDWNKSRVDLNDEAVCFTDGSRINSTVRLVLVSITRQTVKNTTIH